LITNLPYPEKDGQTGINCDAKNEDIDMNASITTDNVDAIDAALVLAWGGEWFILSNKLRWLVAQDFYNAHCEEGISSDEYKARIYEGNLESYAKTLS
jgi:hypothetical protein